MSSTGGENGEKIQKSDAEWKKSLTAQQFQVLRLKGTEPARTGEYDKFYPSEGHFVCAGCGNALYSAESKFNSGCGWPAFDKCYEGVGFDEYRRDVWHAKSGNRLCKMRRASRARV